MVTNLGPDSFEFSLLEVLGQLMILKMVNRQFLSLNTGSTRLQRLKYAAASSLGSKVVTVIAQFVTLPIAAQALGQRQFALYSVLVAATAWLSFANLGVNPSLITGVASADAVQDHAQASRLLTSALLPVALIAGLLTVLAGVFICFFPVWNMLGSEFGSYRSIVRSNLLVLAVIVIARTTLSIVEAAQIGFQETHYTNIRTMVGGVFSIIGVVLVAHYYPTVTAMILAVNLPVFIAQLANSLLFFHKRPFLFPRLGFFNWAIFRTVLASGLLFSLAGTFGAFVNHQLPTIMISRTQGVAATATFASYMNCFTLLFGFISMLAMPLWPALSNSLATLEWDWARQAYKYLLLFSMLYAVTVAVGMVFFGNMVIKMLFGAIVQGSGALALAFAVYFVVDVWEYTHYMVLIGFGHVKRASVVYCVRSIFFVLLVPMSMRLFGLDGVVWSLVIAVVAVTAWSYPYLIHKCVFGNHEASVS